MAKNAILKRSMKFDTSSFDPVTRTIKLAFASEQEYPRWFGLEVLGHSAPHIDFSRLNAGAPILWQHDTTTLPYGTLESYELGEDKVLRGVVRFSQEEEGAKLMRLVADGIVGQVSVGYYVNSMVQIGERDGQPIMLVDNWTPFEVSFVNVGADYTVGVGRDITEELETVLSRAFDSYAQTINAAEPVEASTPAAEVAPEATEQTPVETVVTEPEAATVEGTDQPVEATALEAPAEGTDNAQAASTDQELERVKTLEILGRAFGAEQLAEVCIKEGKTPDQFKAEVDEFKRELSAPTIIIKRKNDMDNFKQAVRHVLGLETASAELKEVSAQTRTAYSDVMRVSKSTGKDAIILPASEVFGRDYALDTGAAGVAGVINKEQGSLITHNFNATILGQLGVLELNVANGATVDMPRDIVGEAIFGFGERTAAGEDTDTFGHVEFKPHRMALCADFTTPALLSSGIDLIGLARSKFITKYDLTVQKLFFGNGLGNPKAPVGLLGSGVNAVAGLYSNARNVIIDAVAAVEVQNTSIGQLAMNKKTYWNLAKVAVGTNGEFMAMNMKVLGMDVVISNALADGEIWFGSFEDTAVARFGAVALYADQDYKSGMRSIILESFVDVGAMKPELITRIMLTVS